MAKDEDLAITPNKSAPMLHPLSTNNRKPSLNSILSANEISTSIATNQKNELNTLMGVYIPCMLSILGAILFLRLSWAVGQAGFFGVVGIFLISGSAVFLTALSISAISTNGTMGGGGAYYMISRSIGPEFGGAVGIIFYFANAFATTFYLVAFADSIVNTFFDDAGVWTKILIASIALVATLIAAYIGADFFSKLNALILSFIILSICVAVISLFFGHEFNCTVGNPDGIIGFTGLNTTTFVDNLTPDYGPVVDDATGEVSTTEDFNFFGVFGIVFPAMTGIMAGANLSGDLKDPGRSIGKGTIYAIGSSLVIYIGLAFLIAWCITGDYLRDETQALQMVACWTSGEYWVVLGIISSTLSSALGALTGAARVLQAFCKDFSSMREESSSKLGNWLLQMLRFFSYGTPGKNEPRYAVILTWAIAQSLLLLGSLDLLASIITNCFLLTYFFTNFACFLLRVTGAPNFRPRFRYFSWHTAFLGALLNVVIMFLASPIFAIVSILLMILVFGIILYSAPEVPWGDVSQGLIYHQVRKYLLRLDERKRHPKFWRPSILFLLPTSNMTSPSTDLLNLIDFSNNLKKGGLYILGDVVRGDLQQTGNLTFDLLDKWNRLISILKVKAFTEVTLAPNYRLGCQNLMIGSGIGGMKPNTVVLSFLNEQDQGGYGSSDANSVIEEIVSAHQTLNPNQTGDLSCPIEYLGIIHDALYMNKNVLLLRNFHYLDKEFIVHQVHYGLNAANGSISNNTAIQHKESDNEGNDDLNEPLRLQKVKKKLRETFYIDIWFTDELDPEDLRYYSGTLSLMLQLAHGLNRTDIWQESTSLRIVHLLRQQENDILSQDMIEHHRQRMEVLLKESRVEAKLEILIFTETDSVNTAERVEKTNEFIRQHTDKTAIMFLNLPSLPDNQPKEQDYLEELKILTTKLPPTVLTMAGQREQLIATEI